jgi:heme/copper-type cytochrome/quinol oxidase subunit 2
MSGWYLFSVLLGAVLVAVEPLLVIIILGIICIVFAFLWRFSAATQHDISELKPEHYSAIFNIGGGCENEG